MEHLQKLITHGLTKGTGGNISMYNPQEKLMAISPSGMDYFTLLPEDIVLMDLEGNIVDGKRKPSSEHEMHSIFTVNGKIFMQSSMHIVHIPVCLHV